MPETADVDGRMPTIYEDDAEGDPDSLVCEAFYEELMSELPGENDSDYERMEEFLMYPMELTPDNTVAFYCPATNGTEPDPEDDVE